MVRIRLRRVGAKKQPSYRVVVANSKSPRDGRFIESIGFYNPRTDPPVFNVKEDRALHWLDKGAQPSEAVLRLLNKAGTMEKFERMKAGEKLEELLTEDENGNREKPAPPPIHEVAAEPKSEEETEEPESEEE